jgi:hypothetical protein
MIGATTQSLAGEGGITILGAILLSSAFFLIAPGALFFSVYR